MYITPNNKWTLTGKLIEVEWDENNKPVSGKFEVVKIRNGEKTSHVFDVRFFKNVKRFSKSEFKELVHMRGQFVFEKDKMYLFAMEVNPIKG